ncbi:uncharacterized protein LOC114527699 [Dendronephthya gigantea]|uniref:uncharacterized protein LOC114527699 n=1 Tax=Dendronephthya gigantea TaxID=151771 RepID=UPI001069B9FB|nr:uncharacterized protein LOC114527699 [Dendronephthya gigantea]
MIPLQKSRKSVDESFDCLHGSVPDYSLATVLTHDQKEDLVAEAYTSLKGLVQTLVEVHTTIQEDVENTTNNLNTLKDSETRSSYAVDVMDTENRRMIAEIARRGTILSPEELRDQEAQTEAINVAKNEVKNLGSNITSTKNELDQVNSQMASMKLTAADLADLQNKANAKQGAGEESITIPTTESIKIKVDEQLTNMQNVVNTLPESQVRKEAQRLKDDIAAKFNILLDPNSALTFTAQQQTAKQIDIALLHFRALDIYGAARKMEL